MGCYCLRDKDAPPIRTEVVCQLKHSKKPKRAKAAEARLVTTEPSEPNHSPVISQSAAVSLENSPRGMRRRGSDILVGNETSLSRRITIQLESLLQPQKRRRNVKQTLTLNTFRYVADNLDQYYVLEDSMQPARAHHNKTQKRCSIVVWELQNAKRSKQMSNRLKAMHSADHPHVLRVMDLLRNDQLLYVVFEAAEGGSAEAWLARGEVSEQLAAEFMRQLFAALLHCTKKGIVLHSVSLKDIHFRERPSSSSLWIKLCVALEDTPDLQSPFVAPEVRKREYSGEANLIYSCGMILSALLIGSIELKRESPEKVSAQLDNYYKKFSATHSEGQRFLTALLASSYAARPSIEECLQHPWLAPTLRSPELTPALRTALRSIQTVKPLPPLRRLLLQLIYNFVISEEELRSSQTAFRDADADLSGEVGLEELRGHIFRLFPEPQAKEAYSTLQQCGLLSERNTLSYSAFVILVDRKVLLGKNYVPMLFSLLDMSHEGRLTISSLQSVFVLQPENDYFSRAWGGFLEQMTGKKDGVQFDDFRAYLLAFI